MEAQRPRRGIFSGLGTAFFGERDPIADALNALSNRGSHLFALGRFLSYLLLFAFSCSALVALARQSLQQQLALILAHQMPDPVAIMGLLVIVLFVIGSDLTMVIMAELMRHGLARGKELADFGWQLALVFMLAAIESTTYVLTVYVIERPDNFVAWALVFARAVVIPIVAIVLATRTPHAITMEDYEQMLSVKFAHHLMFYLDSIDLSKADAGQLIKGLIETQHLPQAQQERLYRLVETVSALAPESMRKQMEARIAAAEQQAHEQADAAQRDAREQVERARAANQQQIERVMALTEQRLNEGQRDAREQLIRTIAHLAQHGTLPEELVQEVPELAALNFRVPRRNGVTREPRTQTDRMNAFLHNMGIEPANRPAGKRGVWIRSTDVSHLVEGELAPKKLREIMHDTGSEEKDGTALIAPIDDVMRLLIGHGLVSETAYKAWRSLLESAQESETNLSTISSESVA